MKKTISLIASLLLATVTLYAQTEKGSQSLGLNLSYYHLTTNNLSVFPGDNSVTTYANKTSSFSFGPNYSYFIADKLDAGAYLTYQTGNTNTVTSNSGYPVKQSSNSIDGRVYLRKYFMYKDKIGIRTGPFVQYGHGNNKMVYTGDSAIYDQNSKTDDYSAGMTLELVYFPSKKLGFSANLANMNYTRYKTNNGSQGHTDGDSFNLSYINNGLGLSVFYML